MVQPSKPTDGELLTAFLADNGQAAFAELVDRYGSMVHGVCLRVLTDHHEAQDVAQAVFLALARKAATMRGAESVGGWLHKVAWRLAINTQQSRIRRQRREENAMRDQPTMSEDQPDAGLFRTELDAAVNQLPDRYRQPLVLFHLLGCSLDETSRQLSLNPSTTGNRLARAREMLRKKLIRRGVTAGTVGALTTLLSAEAGAAVLPATFISVTVQAASLAATGNLAAGVGTGVVSAKVAALTKGAIQMMFIAQLKTAALITAACVVVAGGGAVVAKEMLTPPAAPVSAQAEQKTPPSATATNDTATIAWGEAVNGLQAGLVPLGKGAEGDWGEEGSIFFCPKCAGKPRKHCMDPSEAAKKRVCAVCGKAKPWSATFIEGEPMRMELHVGNVGKAQCILHGSFRWPEWPEITFTPSGPGVARKPVTGMRLSRPSNPCQLGVDGHQGMLIDLRGRLYRDARQDRKEPDLKSLAPGKYTVVATYSGYCNHATNTQCPLWHGTVTTGPVEIEIVPATTGAVKHAFGQLPYDARKTLGNEGWLFIRSQARLDQVLEQFHAVEKPVRLPPMDFDKEMVFCHYAIHDPDDKDEVVACTGDAQRLTLSLLQGIVGNRDMTPKPKIHVVFCVVPKTREFRLTTAQWVGASSPLLDAATARKDVMFDRTFAPEQGDVVAGLRGSIRAEKNEIQPGEDIKIEFKLEWDDPNTGRKQASAGASQPVYVWDGKYSEGYRNHAFLVETPDGKTELLRRPGQLAWDKNIPHPVEIKDGQPYVLPEWVEGNTWKSLKALGIETTKPGVYKVTGIYMETAGETDGMAGRKPDGGKYPMWGGNLAANTVAIRVGDAR